MGSLPGDPAPFSVLVVDDDWDTVESTATLLQLHGFRVASATDAEEALRLAAIEPPSVALIDLAMPGMTGCELARHIRGLAPGDPPVLVAVTGCETESHMRAAERAGFSLYLIKPVAPAVLVEFLRDCRTALAMMGAVAGATPTGG